jgi:methionyl-tRNA formyltransferase
MGARQAGCIGLLAALGRGIEIHAVVRHDDYVGELAGSLELQTFASILDSDLEMTLAGSDLLISVHGREVVPPEVLSLPRRGGINVHPCLYAYKGANPVGRLLEDGNPRASVGVHKMTERVDEGELLVEEFVDVGGETTIEGVYNRLYPYYAIALVKAIDVLGLQMPPKASS